MKKLRLSISKLRSIIDQNAYTISRLYVEGNACRLLECRSSIHYIPFFIYLPDKFEMLPSSTYDMKNIIRKESIQESIKEYLKDLPDTLLVSNDKLIVFSNEKYVSFEVNRKFIKEKDPVENIDKVIEKEEKHQFKQAKVKIVEPEDTIDQVELIFEDDEGDHVNNENPITNLIEIEDDVLDFEPPEYIEDDTERYIFGYVYPVIDISYFMKNISSIEDTIVQRQSHIRQIEKKNREARIIRLKEVTEELVKKMDEKYKNYEIEFDRIDGQINKLVTIMFRIKNLSSKPKRPNLTDTTDNAKVSMSDLYNELAKNRDEYDTMLCNILNTFTLLISEF